MTPLNFHEYTIAEYPMLLDGNIGCCVVDHWEPVVTNCLTELEKIRQTQLPSLRVKQIKEKFGTLRICWSCDKGVANQLYSIVEDLVVDACTQCANICVVCGSTQHVRRGVRSADSHWILTLCNEHRYEAPEQYDDGA